MGVTGNIWLNNQRYEKWMKRKLAYVLQEDIFFENLTVKQQLIYTSLLRLPNDLTRKDKLVQVEQIIEQLSLQNCVNTPIKLISGGEKKRVNIGTELLTNPSVILLDEPTSGLDSTSAVAIISVLRQLASKGKTIITSIHQPSSQIFQSFDQLILLANGKTIYMGKPSNAVNYFSTLDHYSPPQYNTADFIMDLVNQSVEVREELKDAYIQNRSHVNENGSQSELQQPHKYSIEGRKYLTKEPSGNEPEIANEYNIKLIAQKHEDKWPIGFCAQMLILFSRTWILTSRNQFNRLNFFQAFLLAIIFGLLWFRMNFNENTLLDRSTFIFYMMIFWPFEATFTGLLSFPSERLVIDKERASGSYRLGAYFLAKSLAETPLKLVLPTIFFIIAYWMANINPNFACFLGILIFLLMLVIVCESLGLLLGALCQNLPNALVAANVVLLTSLLGGGYFIQNTPHWIIVWSKWLLFFKYGYDACLQLQFMSGHLYQCINGAYIDVCRNNTNGTFTGDDALRYFNVDLSIGLNFLVLFAMLVAYRGAAYIALRFVKNSYGRT